jgi:RepB DNA-primase from phage plasmid/CHC2 zinc finger
VTATRSSRPAVEQLVAYLAALAGQAPPEQLLELRYRRTRGGMGQRFFSVARPDAAAAAVTVLGRRQDVYIGAALRARREGTREAVAAGWALWADCDGPNAAEALAAFDPAPAIVVRSGSGENRHAYWPLTVPLPAHELERANGRVAGALGADDASTDAARVLRPPTSLNFKHDPPTLVALERFSKDRFETAQLLAALPEPRPARQPGAPAAALVDGGADDPLRAIDPAIYVAALTGLEVGRDRKINCPLHPDRTPSLHVYETPEDGWFCFGCRRGGSIYDLAAPLLEFSTRGRGFIELRARLYEMLLPGREPPTPKPRPSQPARRRRVAAKR